MDEEMLKLIKEGVDRIERKIDGHDTRIRSLEDTRSEGRGMGSVLKIIFSASGVSAVISYLVNHMGGQ
ncbi:MAG: hypothetical protein KGJ90_07185 [Patescibacteria group bacterium]|nr:hypothetical protein [Patescibacteria group bacterium]